MARHPDTTEVETRPQDVTYMWEIHKEILRTLVLGFRPKEIAQMFSVTEGFISNLRNSPLARRYLETLEIARDSATAEVARELIETCPTAAKLLKDVIEGSTSASLNLQVETAKDWLSRAGFPKVQKTESINKHGIDAETLDVLKKRATAATAEAKKHEIIAEFEEEKSA